MAFLKWRRKWPLAIVLIVLLGSVAGCSFLGQGFRPAVPTGLSATSGTFVDRVRLTWEPVPDASGYEVWRSSAADGTYARVGLTDLPAYDDMAVTPGSTYWYKVRACNRAGCSDFTNPISGWARRTAVPSPPTGVTASQGTYTHMVVLTWQPSAGAHNYEIYRAPFQTASYTFLDTVTIPKYEDAKVKGGVVYWYQVRACGSAGCSLPSHSVSGYASAATLLAPEGVTASDGTEADKVVVSWQKVNAATSYQVYRAGSKNGTYVLKAETGTTSWTDTTVTPGTTYWYKVRACTTAECGPLSSPDSGYAGGGQSGPPPPPSSR